MKTDAKQLNFLQKIQLPEATSKAGRFLWHFAQMVMAMEAGMMIYHLLVRPLLAPTGFSVLTMEYPLFGYWMMVVSMVLGMLALMLYHRSTWRYSLDMTIAMLAPLAAFTVMVLCNVLPIHTLYGIGDPLMFLAMAAFMLYRPHEHAHAEHELSCH
jgi:flagellar biosynthetic protein FliP